MRLKLNFIPASVLTFAVLLSTISPAIAARRDEGMFTPDQIARLNLAKRGLKIKPADIYNPGGTSLSDAVVRLSVGCTAEFVSPEGLILTNHHCGFDALVSASTTSLDYTELGYKSNNRGEELPAKNYTVFIPQRVEDVSAKVIKGSENLTGDTFTKAINASVEKVLDEEKAKVPANAKANIKPLAGGRAGFAYNDIELEVKTINSGYFYYLYESKLIRDVRVVYAPPRNIGVFGGDPDNFEWTRHTGDFTFLRAYVAPDGSSAAYSTSNVPFKPKKYLTVNIGGVKENDFVFVMGYPGTTTRYRESQAVDYAQNFSLPFLSSYLQARSDAFGKVGETSEEKRIKYQSQVANFDNYRKAYGGGSLAIKRNDTIAKRRAEEQKFAAWVTANPQRQAKYGEVLPQLKRLSDEYYASAQRDIVLQRFPNSITTGTTVTPIFNEVYNAILAVQSGRKLTDDEKQKKLAAVREAYGDLEPIYERELIKFALLKLAELPDNLKFAAAENLFNRFQGKERRAAEETFAESIVERGSFDTPEKIVALYGMSLKDLQKAYPNIVDFVVALGAERNALTARTMRFNSEIDRYRLLYQQGMAEMRGTRPYPDANSTLRFTYGNVRGYSPREAVSYSPFTTLKGILEKDTGVEPFDAPQKLKDLQKAQDFGRFGANGTVPVNFIATTDIIGGNSGSPLMNGNGEQVGLVFDGNYEGLGNDIFFNEAVGRTIAVDIRYVLFVTEKFGGAGWILNEMNIKGGAPKAKSATAE